MTTSPSRTWFHQPSGHLLGSNAPLVINFCNFPPPRSMTECYIWWLHSWLGFPPGVLGVVMCYFTPKFSLHFYTKLQTKSSFNFPLATPKSLTHLLHFLQIIPCMTSTLFMWRGKHSAESKLRKNCKVVGNAWKGLKLINFTGFFTNSLRVSCKHQKISHKDALHFKCFKRRLRWRRNESKTCED